jgi:hypothetical protein
MRAIWTLPLLLSACGFDGAQGQGDPDGDGGGNPIDGAPADSPACTSTGFLNLCDQTANDENFIVGSTELNSDTDNRCKVVVQTSGPNICLLYFNRVEIMAGGTLSVSGSRPLALVAKDTFLVRGTLDVSSRRDPERIGAGSARTAAGLCSFTSGPQAADGGGAGGAGGTFITRGGSGGVGNSDNSGGGEPNRAGGVPGLAITAPAFLRGGCDGQKGAPDENDAAGAGGHGGGAVYLSGASLDISGSVLAGGAGGTGGGVDDGGGGGGSGGMIVVQSGSLKVSGRLLANGGAGGQGGGGVNPGKSGDDGVGPPAARGGDMPQRGGNGGNGANGTGANTNGATGGPDSAGGGGGGAGRGFILLLSPSIDSAGAMISPPADRPPQ